MLRSSRRATILAGVAVAASLAAQRLPPRSRSNTWPRLELLSQTGFSERLAADIWVHRAVAYLGTASCGHGVLPVDVSNPGAPQPLDPLLTNRNSTAEDVMVIGADTPAFQGDLLGVGLQQCRQGGARGVEFWDVTDPRRPERLAFLQTGATTNGVHELYLFQRGSRVFALLAVPGSDTRGGADFRIVEATDPRDPRQIGDWGFARDLQASAPGSGASRSLICHSAWANEEGTVAYLSYWDGGAVILDISDPTSPRFLGRAAYAPPEEGNTHSAWPLRGGSLLLVTDEDFWPRAATLEITEPVSRLIDNVEGSLTSPLCAREDVAGEVSYVGRGCNTDTYESDRAGTIALIDNGACPFREKILRAQAAGAIAVIVAHTAATPQAMGGDPAGIDIPGVMISESEGVQLKAALAAGGLRALIRKHPELTWGFLRIFDISDPANPRPLNTFATPHTRQCPPPDGGWYTVHNPFLAGDTLYLSWYSDGVRMLDISDPANLREIAFFVPPENPMVWGVYARDDLVYLSDINNGLFILRRRGN